MKTKPNKALELDPSNLNAPGLRTDRPTGAWADL